MSIFQQVGDPAKNNLPISTNLFSQLQEDILRGKLQQGEKLTEQRICDLYHVSRTPVREVLKQLENEGLVETIPNRGAFVVGFSDQDMDDMYELRKIYEMQAVRWAIQRITDEEFEDLKETFEFMEFYTMKKDIDKMLSINTSFHQQIYNATHNRMLAKMLSSYQIYVKNSRNPHKYGEDYLNDSFKEHKAVFDAFVNKDVEAGVLAMRIHMDNSAARRGHVRE